MGLEIRISILKIKKLDPQISIENETEKITGEGKQSQPPKPPHKPMQKPQLRISSKITNQSALIQSPPPSQHKQSIRLPKKQNMKRRAERHGIPNNTLNFSPAQTVPINPSSSPCHAPAALATAPSTRVGAPSSQPPPSVAPRPASGAGGMKKRTQNRNRVRSGGKIHLFFRSSIPNSASSSR